MCNCHFWGHRYLGSRALHGTHVYMQRSSKSRLARETTEWSQGLLCPEHHFLLCPLPGKKWPQPATQNQWSFKITVTGSGGLSAVIVNRRPTEEQGQREKEQLDKNMVLTLHIISQAQAQCFQNDKQLPLWAPKASFFLLYWKQSICSRQHY